MRHALFGLHRLIIVKVQPVPGRAHIVHQKVRQLQQFWIALDLVQRFEQPSLVLRARVKAGAQLADQPTAHQRVRLIVDRILVIQGIQPLRETGELKLCRKARELRHSASLLPLHNPHSAQRVEAIPNGQAKRLVKISGHRET